jgi:hypothetical protein
MRAWPSGPPSCITEEGRMGWFPHLWHPYYGLVWIGIEYRCDEAQVRNTGGAEGGAQREGQKTNGRAVGTSSSGNRERSRILRCTQTSAQGPWPSEGSPLHPVRSACPALGTASRCRRHRSHSLRSHVPALSLRVRQGTTPADRDDDPYGTLRCCGNGLEPSHTRGTIGNRQASLGDQAC